jgi:cyclophilin family peptidyl-prolyl cis-trans isomerase
LLGHDRLLARFDAESPPSLDGVPNDFHVEEASGIRLHTSVGPIIVDFRGVPAPMNQANVVALARRGYFDGTRVHHVVAGVVVQGGDPRSDGYGGPGYLVPCEWSNLRFERGTVGVASLGKDTGGGQIFITQTDQPQLDARYTVLGRVVEGLDVLDQILPGDEIERVDVLDL